MPALQPGKPAPIVVHDAAPAAHKPDVLRRWAPDVFYTTIILTLNDGSRVDWFFIGPKTGSFPADPLPADYNIDNQIDENGYTYISMGMSSYGKAQPFQQYINEYVERSRLPIEQQLIGKWREFNNVFVQIQP